MTRKDPMNGGRVLRILHVVLFAAFLIAWTIALLLPVPAQSAERVLGDSFSVFIFGKGVHVAAFAFLTVLGGTAALFGRNWVWLVPGLVAYGGLTEILQGFVGRTPRIADVGLDAIGVGLGALVVVGWRWFTRPARREEAATPVPADRESASPRHPLPSAPPSPPSAVGSD